MSANPGSTLLVLDDDGSAGRAIANLQQRGYTILRAVDGSSALWLAHRAHIDVFVVDLTAPGAFEFLEEKAADPQLRDVPLLVVTVFADELKQAGYDNVMSPTMH
jgi:CheY-like chemotaxis protein